MRVMQPIERTWTETAMSCRLEDSHPGHTGPWWFALMSLAVAVHVLTLNYAFLAETGVLFKIGLGLSLPTMVCAFGYAAMVVLRDSGTPPTELRLSPTELEIAGSRLLGVSGAVSLGRVGDVRVEVHPVLALSLTVDAKPVRIPAAMHSPEAIGELAAEIREAVARFAAFREDQRRASAEHAGAIEAIVGSARAAKAREGLDVG